MPDGAEFTYEIAFSFAGENIERVEKIAIILRDAVGEGKVFHFPWFEAEIGGMDAAIRLQKIYHDQSRLVVPCVCQRYADKPWTQDEWRALLALERDLRDETSRYRFLPVRVGEGEPDGIYPTAIVFDIRDRSPESAAQLILDRLNKVRESTGLQLFDAISQQEPQLGEAPLRRDCGNLPRQPFFFGREDELKTIAEALEPNRRTWGTLIDGPGGIGKTALAVRAAELTSPEHFERVVFVTSKGRQLDSDG